LLVLARLEGDNKPPSDQLIDMGSVMRHLREDAASLSGERHRITFDVDDALTVTGVETEILSALGNLVTNAIRYTPDGGTIHVDWRMRGGSAVFSVTDSGFGIPAVDIPRLTERFYRVDVKRSRERGGTGLGLAIVKHIINRHQGRLQIESKFGEGSTFTILLPAVAPSETKPATALAASPTGSPSGVTEVI